MPTPEGIVALVSGASCGIGAAIEQTLAAADAKVVIGDVLDTEGQSVATSIGASARYARLDVTRPADSIINISSIAGLTALPFNSSYVATKFGLRGLTKAAALDLGRYGIRVNSAHPGFIHTPLTAAAEPDTTVLALSRGGSPAEIAKLVCFLASDDSSFSTGAEFIADGGETAGNLAGGSLSGPITAAAKVA